MTTSIRVGMALAIWTGAALAQQNSYSGQSWVGLLVSGSCKTPSSETAATRESELTTNSRTTTPGVDNSGTRGSSSMLDPEADRQVSSGRDVPHTGDIRSSLPKGLVDPGWKKARKQAAALGNACGVGTTTDRFALLLPDGTTLAFDDLANVAVKKQLPAGADGGKIFRVRVSGKVQNGKIALDTIRM